MRTRRTVAAAAAALLVPLAGGAFAHADTGREGTLAQQQQQQEEVDTDSDWEWIGIFGLLGLLGLVPRRRTTERTAHEPGRGARP
ncbi:WGxxGxxG family protein [Saccharomonospora cyanea]|uniref:MYXO-CTERM domain-containing protein n=1 Tax=Saccharomonospora cyanea NA-134 TaxID=882082 RepID=H5XPF1_9PSEU|nr:WGxxGxxG family protein [Saccharomonospora cyanea]EHR58985.1 hypothetical protein SaccyDRAFT_0043 [Saccharomonospora cyanea NA-134]